MTVPIIFKDFNFLAWASESPGDKLPHPTTFIVPHSWSAVFSASFSAHSFSMAAATLSSNLKRQAGHLKRDTNAEK